MTKILLTGATGFIGKATLDVLLKTPFEIHALHRIKPKIERQGINWHACDVLDKDQVSQLIINIKPDYLIHLAWTVEHQLFWSAEKNVDYIAATLHLYRTFSEQDGKKAVFLGTCAEYDKSYPICHEEKTPLKPDTLYGLCKKQTFELLQQFKKMHPEYADFAWVRIFNIFGPHEHQARLLPAIFLAFLQKKLPPLRQPNALRDHIYVENVAEILLHLCLDNTTSAINVGSSHVLSIWDLAKTIQQQFFPDQGLPKNDVSLNDCFTPDLTKLKALNIQFTTDFASSLEKTYQWWSTQVPTLQCEE